jgi:hypothetical protein
VISEPIVTAVSPALPTNCPITTIETMLDTICRRLAAARGMANMIKVFETGPFAKSIAMADLFLCFTVFSFIYDVIHMFTRSFIY